MKRYPRTALAERLADDIGSKNSFGDAWNGLFLAAPRRTGKSTFLRHDLRPELEGRDHVVLYVDLWSNVKLDPGAVVADEIGRAIRAHAGKVSRWTREAGIVELDIGGTIKVDTSRIGQHEGLTLTDALGALGDLVDRRPIVLMIEEAQHALTSEDGAATMTALKAARDALNSPDRAGLVLVMTGSDRDKLLRLVNANAAPFFGSRIRDLPLLDEEFVAFAVGLLEADNPRLGQVDVKALSVAFRAFGHRPQLFADAVSEALDPLGEGGERFEGRVLRKATEQRTREEARMRDDFLSLKPLEMAVVWRMFEEGSGFRAFGASALASYRATLSSLGADDDKVTASRVQGALNHLRDRDPAIVWKSSRGEYAIDDVSMQHWYRKLRESGRWPPSPAPSGES